MKMYNGPLSGIVDSFSTFQLIKNYNRLVAPTDLSQYYNLTLVKDIDQSSLRYGAMKPTDLILASSAMNSFRSYSGGINVLKNTNPDNCSLRSPVPPNLIESPKLNTTTAADRHTPSTFNLNESAIDICSENDQNNRQNIPIENSSLLASPTDRSMSSIEQYHCLLSRRQRSEKRPIPDEQKDEKYFERRKRNNEAAKKSRDARKLREDRIAFRAAFLERENAILRAQILALRDEVTTLQQMICNRPLA